MAMLVALATEKPDPVERAGPLKPVLNGLLQKNPKNRMRMRRGGGASAPDRRRADRRASP